MPRRWAIALGLLLSLSAPLAHARDGHPRMVRIELRPELTPAQFLEAGLDVVELHGREALVLEWPGDESLVASVAGRIEVVDEDPEAAAAARARAEQAGHPKPAGQRVLSATAPDGIFRLAVLPPFGSGSMGGYWTLDEVKMKLDQLVANDTHDVVADKLDTLGYSIEGRPIWGLKLGKSVTGPDTRPVAFYNALTHAREPEGMQALFYFVDDVLNGYGVDATATYLLDHRVLYIVPVVNPDGYRYNQTTNPGGGGMWRKNTRDNDGNGQFNTNQDGVDLNRNYAFQWGVNNSGSSPTPSSDIYRGSGPFSEPETRAERDIIVALQPKVALSFHSYADLLLHSWGYTATATDDSSAFYEWDDLMSLGCGYQSGQSTRVLYDVNGEFDDWCYGDTQLKPRLFGWTPEVGNNVDGFWPAPSRIVPIARENLRACYMLASIAGPYVRVERFDVLEGFLNRGSIAHVVIHARHRGSSGTAGPGLTATLSTLSPGAHVLQSQGSFPTLGPRQSGDQLPGSFVVSADDTVTLGRVLRFQVDFSAPDGFFSRDTLEMLCGTPTVLFADNASGGLGNWTTTSWGVGNGDPAHPGPFFADSPIGVYGSLVNNPFTLRNTLAVTPGVHAYALYDARWDFETDIDCGLIEVSTNGSTWTPVASLGTSLGAPNSNTTQPTGQPVYDGTSHAWRGERADLSAYMGIPNLRFRFRVRSNTTNGFDGLNVDSLRIVVFDPAAQPTPVAVGDGRRPDRLQLAPPTPNPARDEVRLDYTLPRAGRVGLEVLDLEGRRVRTFPELLRGAGRYGERWDLADDRGRPVKAGVFFVRLTGSGDAVVRRFAVVR